MKKTQKIKGKLAKKAAISGFIRLSDLANNKCPNFDRKNKSQLSKSNLTFRQKSVRHR
jgi:CRISPR/Cas system CMR-associated protein Cmr3 (group 5 of RAMP superfamily)